MKSRLPLVLALALIGAVWWIGRSSANEAAERERAAIKENTALTLALRANLLEANARRDSLASARAEILLINRRHLLDKRLLANRASLDTARAVLADTLATIETLRVTLSVTVERADSLAFAVSEYRTAADSLQAKQAAERKALYAVIAAKDTALTASLDAMRAWKGAAICKIAFLKCPTRTQSFIAGAVVTAAVIVAVRK